MEWKHHLFNDRWAIEDIWRGMRGGFFVEAGAVNGLNGSATHVLEHKFGWTGICVEAIDREYEAIPRFRNCKRDNRALYSESGLTLDFALITNRSGRSGLRNHLREKALEIIASQEAEKTLYLPKQTVSLSDLLREHEAPELVHYVCLDIEGAEPEVMGAFDFNGPHKILSISIEGHQCDEIMGRAGYTMVSNPHTEKLFERYFLHPEIDRYRLANSSNQRS